MQKEKQVNASDSNGTNKLGSILFVSFMTVLTIVAVMFFFNRSDARQWEERADNLNTLMQQFVLNIETITNTHWEKVEAVACRLHNTNATTDEDLFGTLAEIEQEMPEQTDKFLLYSEWGQCYDSQGKKRRWDAKTDLTSQEQKQLRIYNLYGLREDGEQMVFLYRLSEPIRSDTTTFTHVALVCDMSTFDSLFLSQPYGENTNTYIINPDGTQVYHRAQENCILTAYNILREIRDDEFLYNNNFEQLENDISIGKSECVHFKHNGTELLMAYRPMQGNSSWYVLMLVPAMQVSANTEEFLLDIVFYFTAVAVIICVFFFTLVHINARTVREKQKQANTMLQSAAEKERLANQAKSRFLSCMSHDIRTPINGISGMIYKAQKNITNHEIIKECLDKIDRSSSYLLAIINDVLDMSRIESGKTEIIHEPVAIEEMLQECVHMLEVQAREKSVEILCQFETFPYKYLYGDALHLQQIFINILSNAVKFSNKGERVILRAKEKVHDANAVSLCVEIKDTGIGMSEDFQKHIFEPFAQENESSRTNYHGTGLGMTIVGQLVKLMDGTVEVISKEGEGSTFRVCIPMEIVTELPEECRELPAEENTDDVQGCRILLAEDNEINLEIALFLLEELGAIVTVARDGKETVQLFEESTEHFYDLILMDIMMPVMDGIEATETIRSMQRDDAVTVPIVALTANALSEDILAAKEAGMNCHLSKPIDVRDLQAVLRKCKKERPV